MLTNGKGDQTPLDMRWSEENDIDEEKFTVVRSRKKKERKVNVVISRPVTRSQKDKVLLGNNKGNPTLLPSRNTKQGGKVLLSNEWPLLELQRGR